MEIDKSNGHLRPAPAKIAEEAYLKLEQLSAKSGYTRSQLIRSAVYRFLELNEVAEGGGLVYVTKSPKPGAKTDWEDITQKFKN